MTNTVIFQDIDLNTTGTTTVYDPDGDAMIQGAHMPNDGTNAVVQLEITDGSSTVCVTQNQQAGDPIDFSHQLPLTESVKIQVNVTTANGSALTGSMVVNAE